MKKTREEGLPEQVYSEKPAGTKQYPFPGFDDETKLRKPALLLHSCCGPCSSAVMEALASEYDVTIFFYNPNITDPEEYERRKEAQIKCVEAYNDRPDRLGRVSYSEGEYDPQAFLAAAGHLASEPEGGKRCGICFRMRLEKTAETASLGGYDCFATTLSVSPHKNFEIIGAIGRDLCARYGLGFLDRDFKKGDGYARSVAFSRQYGLYRQNYCGCVFSEREK